MLIRIISRGLGTRLPESREIDFSNLTSKFVSPKTNALTDECLTYMRSLREYRSFRNTCGATKICLNSQNLPSIITMIVDTS